MESFEKKWKEHDCNIGVDCLGMACETECKKIAEHWYRAALERVLEMNISSAHCKTELDVLRDWIKKELEEKNELQTVEQNPQCHEQRAEG